MVAPESCKRPGCGQAKDSESDYCSSRCKDQCEPDTDESRSDYGTPPGTPLNQQTCGPPQFNVAVHGQEVANLPPRQKIKISSATWMDPQFNHKNLPQIYAGNVVMKSIGDAFDSLDGDIQNRHPWFGRCVFEVESEEWTLDDFIGYGGHGQVYLATYQRSGKRYVIKFLARKEDPEVKFLTDKQVPFSVFKHANIVTMVGIALDINDPAEGGSTDWNQACHMTFMEAVPNGEIYHILSAPSKGLQCEYLTEPTLRHIVHDMVKALDMLAAAGITHRDLKPENFVLGERGETILLDMGHCKFVDTGNGGQVMVGTRSTGSGGYESAPMPPDFNRMPSASVGTAGYRAPEALLGCSYDMELADVFTVAVLIFMLKLPTNPFRHPTNGTTDFSLLTDDKGADEKLWTRWTQWGGTFSDGEGGLKNFLNCLWRKIPVTPGPPQKSRPRFKDLKLAIEKDQSTLDLWPDLKWLAHEPADHLTLIQELRAHKPDLNLKCSGVIEAFAEYVRKEGDVRKAFACAKDNSLGLGSPMHLTGEELAGKIGCADQVAGLIANHTHSTAGMTYEEFEAMAKCWEFVGGETNWNNCGKHDSRWSAWKHSHPTDGAASEAEDRAIPLSDFTKNIKDALTAKGYRFTRASKEVDAALQKEDGLDHEVFDAKMLDKHGKDRCHVRMNTCIMYEGVQGKFVLESKRRKGSAIDELTMLRNIKDDLKEKLGSPVQPPAACFERRPALVSRAT